MPRKREKTRSTNISNIRRPSLIFETMSKGASVTEAKTF